MFNIRNYSGEHAGKRDLWWKGKQKRCILGENTGSPGQQAPDGNQMEDDRRGKLLLWNPPSSPRLPCCSCCTELIVTFSTETHVALEQWKFTLYYIRMFSFIEIIHFKQSALCPLQHVYPWQLSVHFWLSLAVLFFSFPSIETWNPWSHHVSKDPTISGSRRKKKPLSPFQDFFLVF